MKKNSINRKSFPFPFLFSFFFSLILFLSFSLSLFTKCAVSPKTYYPSQKCYSDLELQSKRNNSGFSMSYLNTSKVSICFYQKYFSPWYSWCRVLRCPPIPQLSELYYEFLVPFSLTFLEGRYKWSKKTDLIWVIIIILEIEMLLHFTIFSHSIYNIF